MAPGIEQDLRFYQENAEDDDDAKCNKDYDDNKDEQACYKSQNTTDSLSHLQLPSLNSVILNSSILVS